MLLSEHNSEFVTMGPYRSFNEGPRLPVKIVFPLFSRSFLLTCWYFIFATIFICVNSPLFPFNGSQLLLPNVDL